MGQLDKSSLDVLIAGGCPACAATTLTFRSYVDALLPLMGGEPVGKLTWVYNGEKFLDGIFSVTCASCQHVVFASPDCPRCHAPDGLERALTGENTYLPPESCPGCDNQEVRFIAFVPARVTYEGKRADKARTSTELLDPGFHGYRVDCRVCGTVAERHDGCPVCEAPGPIRPRPVD